MTNDYERVSSMEIFQLKTKPHGNERCGQFIREKFICIGWPGIGDLSNVSKDQIRENIKIEYGYSGHQLGNALGQVNAFAKTMTKGDLVLVLEKDIVHVGKVSDYEYIQQYDNNTDGMCHRRSVEWINSIKFKDLDNDIQRFVSNRNTICQYPYTISEDKLNMLLGRELAINNDNINKLNCLFSKALKVLEEELKSKDAEQRVRAASEILKLKNRNL